MGWGEEGGERGGEGSAVSSLYLTTHSRTSTGKLSVAPLPLHNRGMLLHGHSPEHRLRGGSYGTYPIVASPPVFVCCEMLTRALCARVTACIDADCPAGEAAELVFRQANSRDLKKAVRGIHGSHQPACGRAKVSCSSNSNSNCQTAASAATHEGTDTVCTVNSAAAVASWRPE